MLTHNFSNLGSVRRSAVGPAIGRRGSLSDDECTCGSAVSRHARECEPARSLQMDPACRIQDAIRAMAIARSVQWSLSMVKFFCSATVRPNGASFCRVGPVMVRSGEYHGKFAVMAVAEKSCGDPVRSRTPRLGKTPRLD